MGQKAANVKAALPQPRVYKSSLPLLVKPGKRSRQEALPSALHMGTCVGLCLLILAIINICVTELLPPWHPFIKLVQSGTMMAMITITVLGTPNLGNSFTKAAQRIAGVMIGGWTFYGLYAACQAWWFLVICLSAWAFILVACSFALSGREFLFPVALVTSFIVVCNFNSVKQALVMTLVKTVAFAGAIALYTVVALLMLPLTATQQLLTTLASALKDIEQLADIVLVTGGYSNTSAQSTTQTGDCLDPEAQSADHAAAATNGEQLKDTALDSKGAAASGRAGKGGKKGKRATASQPSAAVSLAANANHKLQVVQSLLRMTKKERYIGTLGSYKCFLPTLFRTSGVLPEEEVLAVVVNAGQVLRVLITVMSDFGPVPLARRLPSITLGAQAAVHMQPLAEQAVVSLQDISAGLPVSGNSSYPVRVSSLQAYAAMLQQLVSDTVSYHNLEQGPTEAPAAGDSTLASADARANASDAAPATTVAGKWQQAAVAATGLKLPPQGKQQLAAAFSSLLTEAVCSEEGQLARWCSVLVLSRQLGRSIAGLNDSLNEMLAKLPWMNSGTVM